MSQAEAAPAEGIRGLQAAFDRDGFCVDGKSILDLAMLAAECGTHLELEARGPDAEAALAALADPVAASFHEGDEAGYGSLAADGLGNTRSLSDDYPSSAQSRVIGMSRNDNPSPSHAIACPFPGGNRSTNDELSASR